MTDRLKGLVVAFDKDIREDDAECIINAILMIKGVSGVHTSISSSEDYMNRQQIKMEMTGKFYDVINNL